MSIIIIRILGGIGNQLFCYAYARRMALVNNADLVIDNISGFLYDVQFKRSYQLDHFNIPCSLISDIDSNFKLTRFQRFILKRWNSISPLSKRKYYIHTGFDFDASLLNLKINNTIYLEGYWQSEKYFNDIKSILKKELMIEPPEDADNIGMYQIIKSHNSIAVHFRYFDNIEMKNNNNADEDFYKNAFNTMYELVPNPHFFIFSDNIQQAQKGIHLPSTDFTLVDHNRGDQLAYADLWLMTNCNHFIIANSTFSWWGAWLGEMLDSIVIAPDPRRFQITNSWRAKGLLPDRWYKI